MISSRAIWKASDCPTGTHIPLRRRGRERRARTGTRTLRKVVDHGVEHGDRLAAGAEQIDHRRDEIPGLANQGSAWLDKNAQTESRSQELDRTGQKIDALGLIEEITAAQVDPAQRGKPRSLATAGDRSTVQDGAGTTGRGGWRRGGGWGGAGWSGGAWSGNHRN